MRDRRNKIFVVTVLLALILLVLHNLHNVMGVGDYSPCDALSGAEQRLCDYQIKEVADWWHDLGRYAIIFLLSGYLALTPFTMRAITAIWLIVWMDSTKELLDLITNNNIGNPTRDIVIYVGLIAAVVLAHLNAVAWVKERLRN